MSEIHNKHNLHTPLVKRELAKLVQFGYSSLELSNYFLSFQDQWPRSQQEHVNSDFRVEISRQHFGLAHVRKNVT